MNELAAGSRSVLLIGNLLSNQVGNYSVSEDLADKLAEEGYRVTAASRKRSRALRWLDIVGTVLRKRHQYSVANVDVYSGLGFRLAESACLALRMVKKPYVLTLRGGNLPSFGKSQRRRVERLFRGAAAVTTPSRYLLQHLADFRNDIRLLPNPLHLERYPYRLRRTLRPKLIWVRSFHKIYNAPLAIDVVARLASQFPDVELTMVGPDKGDGSLEATERRIDELGVSDCVRIVGGVAKAEIPRLLDEADVLINTTNVDNTPVSVLEALSCGLCVVTTNVGGIPHLLEDRGNAWLVPPNDADAMAGAVTRLLTNAELAASLSAGGRQLSQQFDWSSVLPQWQQLFEEVGQR